MSLSDDESIASAHNEGPRVEEVPDSNNFRNETVIFGTEISIEVVLNDFMDFFRNFSLSNGENYFLKELETLRSNEINVLNLNAEFFMLYNDKSVKLYRILVAYPQELIPILEMGVNEEFEKLCGTTDRHIAVRLFNLRTKCQMRTLNPDQVDTLISVSGMVIRCSEIIPQMKQAVFECATCKQLIEKNLVNYRVEEPESCTACSQKNSFKLLHNHSFFVDMQRVKLQESLEEVEEGETPLSLTLHCYGDMVNIVKPGDRIEVSGILRTKGTRINPLQRVIGTVFSNYIDSLHFKKLQRKNDVEENLDEITETQKEAIFMKIARDKDAYESLAASVAPSLFGLNDMKKGILCLLFGGSNSTGVEVENNQNLLNDGTKTKKTRGEINILLCGDPGVAKSQLLSFVHKVSPRGVYTSGKGSSAVGLTAYVTKDPETNEAVLESGALVLSDRGICCIDEFDKMSDSTRAILHEVMEQQTISVAKAGIITSLNARTSILASANPIQSKYNPMMSVVNNINLPPTLLSRFDLIFLVLDKVEENSDRKLATHIVKLFCESNKSGQSMLNQDSLKITYENFYDNLHAFEQNFTGKKYYDRKLLTEYITFAKKSVSPKITAEAKDELVLKYLELRKSGSQYGSNNMGRKTISATTRQLESLIRLSESLAKMKLQKKVKKIDVIEAVRLMREATQKAAVDPRTGVIDMDAINTGVGVADRRQISALAEVVLQLLGNKDGPSKLSVFEITQQMRQSNSQSVSQTQVKDAVEMLKDEGKVHIDPHSNKVSIS